MEQSIAKLVVTRIQPVSWFITRPQQVQVMETHDPEPITVPCLMASVADHWIKHQGHLLDLPRRAQRVAGALANHSNLLWTPETFSQLVPQSEPWTRRDWRRVVRQVRDALPGHLGVFDGRLYQFQSCGSLVPFSCSEVPEPSPFPHTLGWSKAPKSLTWIALRSVHQVLDIIEQSGALIFNLTAWETDPEWLEALLETAWISPVQIWLWDGHSYPLFREDPTLPTGGDASDGGLFCPIPEPSSRRKVAPVKA